MTIPPPDLATLRQVEAADPSASVWLSANAGSGKTRVLIDRVARLLMDGTDPLNILCLTYTKAAASEMQNRLFQRLGKWAMLDDAALEQELSALGIGKADMGRTDRLARARRLFARAIETPGGLKIQTIHSFCAGLLRRFPLEAGVSPQFTEMDERAGKLLRDTIVEEMAIGAEASLLQGLAAHYTGGDLDNLLEQMARHRSGFAAPLDRDGALAQFGLPAAFDENALLAEVFTGGEAALFAQVLPVIAAGSAKDVSLFNSLSVLEIARPGLAALEVLEDALLYGKTAKTPFGAKIGDLPTKATREALGSLLDPLNDLMLRVEAARPRHHALLAANKTAALHAFARRFLHHYAQRKEARGWLDFDDLILKTRDLLTRQDMAQWVLFRLDGGIDHILVDEAQDTGPEQWRVIESLTQEFGAGEGARDGVTRTIFVVGDKKQSIYSFQGADLHAFDAMQTRFFERLAHIGTGLNPLLLEHSFRSADAVLRVVDETFPPEMSASLGGGVRHIAFHPQAPGMVDLWPAIPPAQKVEAPEWFLPVDHVADDHPAVQLADRIAGWIKQKTDPKGPTLLPARGNKPARPMTAGDVLILVQRRSTLFAEIIRACKQAGLPVAGADRLKLGAELAVRDLAALLSFLATPEDDLSLATVLRSPLCGWSEDRLYRLAQPRGRAYLWRALFDAAAEHKETFAFLSDLRDRSEYLRPYDLIEHVLIHHDGRRRLLARLGAEAEDGIDALLAQALTQERMGVPSLTAFLSWLDADDVEVKRRLDSGGSAIRVMTVHGAKGLEAPVVILPDCAKRILQDRDDLVPDGDHVFWPPKADQSPDMLRAARARRAERQEEENKRLLYVAMTRAESWLIVAAAGDTGKPGEGASWHDLVTSGMIRAQAVSFADFPTGPGLRLAEGTWPQTAATDVSQPAPADVVPDWALRPPPPRARPPAAVTASTMPGAKFLVGEAVTDTDRPEDTATVRDHGTALHALLEHLPRIPVADWPRFAGSLLAGSPVESRIAALLAEARAVLDAPELALLFGPDTLAEVPFSVPLPDGRRLHGTIDRLILSGDRVLAVDFKSNRIVPASVSQVPPGILAQMGAYAGALAQIYCGHRIETAILWTRGPVFMPLDPDIVKRAAVALPNLDVPGTEP